MTRSTSVDSIVAECLWAFPRPWAAGGSFLPSPTIDCFFVVSLRPDPVAGIQAVGTDLSGAVVRRVDEKPPWLIAKELADRASKIRHDDDPEFKRAKAMVKGIPPLLLRPVLDAMGFITESLQLPGLEARPLWVDPGEQRGNLRTRLGIRAGAAVRARAVHDRHRCDQRQGAGRERSSGHPPGAPAVRCLDHRFVDGYQAATMARVFREYLADPAATDPVPWPASRATTAQHR